MRIVYGASEDFRLSTSAAQDTQCLVPPGRSISARGRFVGDSPGGPAALFDGLPVVARGRLRDFPGRFLCPDADGRSPLAFFLP